MAWDQLILNEKQLNWKCKMMNHILEEVFETSLEIDHLSFPILNNLTLSFLLFFILFYFISFDRDLIHEEKGQVQFSSLLVSRLVGSPTILSVHGQISRVNPGSIWNYDYEIFKTWPSHAYWELLAIEFACKSLNSCGCNQ